MRICILVFVIIAVSIAGPVRAGDTPAYTHKEYFETYEGTKTCLECHEDAAVAFFHSQHYQWSGEAPAIANMPGKKKGMRLGKMNSINDFCTNPLPSWIGNAVNEDGTVLAQGCSKCHAGLGKKPEAELSREQLENIDCLMCHANGYRRDLYQNDEGQWEWKPILWENQEGLNSVSKRITLPKRAMCLRCHSGAGGGPNFKRGDIEYALADCDRSFDVHMGTDGGNMECVNCHAGADHRVRGRGADLAATDSPGAPIGCSTADCHGETPHSQEVLNYHTRTVYCTVCHIPEFAKENATDMMRDWSKPLHNEELKKYSATITLEKNVTPVYAWFNGKTHAQLMGEPVVMGADAAVPIMRPDGSRKDKQARIHTFKLHRGVLPVLKENRWLIPVAVDEFFVDGDIDKAVLEGAAVAYNIHDPEYEWVKTIRYMGIFHEVKPAAAALSCLDCHSAGGRMDWKQLGYEGDPLTRRLKRK